MDLVAIRGVRGINEENANEMMKARMREMRRVWKRRGLLGRDRCRIQMLSPSDSRDVSLQDKNADVLYCNAQRRSRETLLGFDEWYGR